MEAPNLLELHARKRLGKSDNWVLFNYETLPKDAGCSVPRTHFQLTGAVPSNVLFKSGPRKGKPNPKFKTDIATVIISEEEQRQFDLQWEKETGLCKDCGDTGNTRNGWSQAEGTMWANCSRCARGLKNVSG